MPNKSFRYTFLFLILMNHASVVLPFEVKVSLYHEKLVHAMLFSAQRGDYLVMVGDSLLAKCPEGESWYLLQEGGGILARDHKGRWHSAAGFSFNSRDQGSYFGLKPSWPALPPRSYLNDLQVRVHMNSLLMLNRIGLEKYIMGVTETEAGGTAGLEFYKVQAILCRTYALKHINRHESEGYNLCDGIHCQAYHGRHIWNEDVEIGVEVTRGLVLTDADSALLNAAYHSNSGGETRSAGDAWLKEEPCLLPVLDPFSLGQPNARWEKRISVGEWISYLKNLGLLEADFTDTAMLELQIDRRQPFYPLSDDTLLFSEIRKDWGLRSDFFSIIRSGGNIILEGRGYGHGVGLSQEGAMHMARRGYHYTEILNYYYHGILIVHYPDLGKTDIFSGKMLHSQ